MGHISGGTICLRTRVMRLASGVALQRCSSKTTCAIKKWATLACLQEQETQHRIYNVFDSCLTHDLTMEVPKPRCLKLSHSSPFITGTSTKIRNFGNNAFIQSLFFRTPTLFGCSFIVFSVLISLFSDKTEL